MLHQEPFVLKHSFTLGDSLGKQPCIWENLKFTEISDSFAGSAPGHDQTKSEVIIKWKCNFVLTGNFSCIRRLLNGDGSNGYKQGWINHWANQANAWGLKLKY